MKSNQEIVTILNNRITKHKKEIENLVQALTELKASVKDQVTNEHRQSMLKAALMIAEHKTVISVLGEVVKEASQ